MCVLCKRERIVENFVGFFLIIILGNLASDSNNA